MAIEPEPLVERRYANVLAVGHNQYEFVLDFGQSYENEEAVRQHSGIVTSPVYAKVFLAVLESAIEQYEASYGEIPQTVTDRQPGDEF